MSLQFLSCVHLLLFAFWFQFLQASNLSFGPCHLLCIFYTALFPGFTFNDRQYNILALAFALVLGASAAPVSNVHDSHDSDVEARTFLANSMEHLCVSYHSLHIHLLHVTISIRSDVEG
ncbi:hypothetical protein BV25DRAFT_1823489 [Artomyces pyxidatus]|uniref:Uncharacterized protein n=1 Tax=Artomyces pyxidatus TaxID=48021 RepID=A0ACB8T697_9AGAM|nr:hypothetical protein BV25DRAFT_1823489 [Artomyces pyxidatus]